MEGYRRSCSSLNWPPVLVKQNYLASVIIIIIHTPYMCRRIKYKGQTVECEQTDRRTRPIALPSLSITRRRRDGSSTVAKIAADRPAVRTSRVVSGVTMGWLLRLVTGGPTGGRGPPTVLFYFKSEGRGPDLRK